MQKKQPNNNNFFQNSLVVTAILTVSCALAVTINAYAPDGGKSEPNDICEGVVETNYRGY